MKKNNLKRTVAAMLIVSLSLPAMAQAAAPQVQTDEAVYVNLDYYGGLKDMRIVKGVTPNGQTTFTDYGDYQSVFNMTSKEKPELGSGIVTWNLESPRDRFYYECTPENPETLQMPWTFDVSYKINGRDAAAEECAGQDALIETTITCIPNSNADEYYQNNMILMVAALVDLSEGDTLDAPEAQIQSVGTYKTAVFMALPGEEKTFTYRVGSRCYESDGTYIMMMPATMGQMDRVRDVREMKEKVSDSHDDLYAGISSVLDLLGGMQSGLITMNAGISGLDAVRQSLTASRDSIIDPDIDATLAALDDLAGRTDSTLPELLSTQDTLTAAQDITQGLLRDLDAVSADTADLRTNLEDLSTILTTTLEMVNALQDTRDAQNYSLSEITNALFRLEKSSRDVSDDLETLNHSLSQAGSIVNSALPIPGIGDTFEDASSAMSSASDLMKQVKLLSNSLSGLTVLMDKLDKTVKNYDELPTDAIETMQQTIQILQQSTQTADKLIQDSQAFRPVIDQATYDAKSTLTKIGELLTSTKTALTASYQTMADLQATLREQRATADANTAAAVDGLLDVLQHTIASTGTTSDLQKAADSIHSAISDEFDELEEDTNVLNIDNTLALQSFTSHENMPPASLQFIVRTDEISVDTLEDSIQYEQETEDIGPWKRIAEVFKKLFYAISSVFTEE